MGAGSSVLEYERGEVHVGLAVMEVGAGGWRHRGGEGGQ